VCVCVCHGGRYPHPSSSSFILPPSLPPSLPHLPARFVDQSGQVGPARCVWGGSHATTHRFSPNLTAVPRNQATPAMSGDVPSWRVETEALSQMPEGSEVEGGPHVLFCPFAELITQMTGLQLLPEVQWAWLELHMMKRDFQNTGEFQGEGAFLSEYADQSHRHHVAFEPTCGAGMGAVLVEETGRLKANCAPCAEGRFSSNLSTFYPEEFVESVTLPPLPYTDECSPCAPGFAALGTAQTTCLACKAGRYSADHGAVQCELCPAGSSTNGRVFSATACTPCPPGFFSGPIGGATVCK